MDPKLGRIFKSGHLITLFATDYVCNFLLVDHVISSGTKPDVDKVARGPNQQRSLECFTLAMTDDRRIIPKERTPG